MAQIDLDSLDALIVEAAPSSETYHLVFVYGSLLSGSNELFHNHQSYLKNNIEGNSPSICIGEGVTERSDFIMLSQVYNSYPYVVNATQFAASQSNASNGIPVGVTPTQIYGEVWKVNTKTLSRLDSLEGFPRHYCRENVPIIVDGGHRPSNQSSLTLSASMNDLKASWMKPTHQTITQVSPLRRSVSLSSTPQLQHKKTYVSQMYLLSDQKKIDAFGLSLQEQCHQHCDDGEDNFMVDFEDVETSAIPYTQPYDKVSEVKPLGDWRAFRTQTFDSDTA